MTYLLIQLFLYLICALVLGLLLGWVIWGARSSRLIAEAKSDGERALREQKERCSEDKAVLQTIIERQTAALEAARAETGRLEKLAALNVENVALAEPQTIPQPAPSGQVRPYHLSVVKSVDGAIVLSGIAPDEAERDKIHALASEFFGEGRFQSRIALANSVRSDDWSSAVEAAFSSLGLLEEGQVELVDASVSLNGLAYDQGVVDKVAVAASAMPKDFSWSDNLNISRPQVSPFTLDILKGSDSWQISGFVPDEATQNAFLSRISQFSGDLPVSSNLHIADGAPSGGWAELVSQGLSALGTLETGHLGISDEFVHLEGWVKPVNLAALNEVTDKRPDWRRGVSVLLEEISPYRVFAHLSNDGVVVLSGFAPGESERDAIIDIASDVFGADHVMSELALAAGKPSGDWSGATACALSALGLLREGSVELIDSNVSLIGTAADQDAVDEVGIIASGVPSGFSWSDKLDILQPRISPFTLDLVKRETFWEIAGYAPDEVTRERLKAALSIDDYETQLSGDLTIADGMPSAAWSDLVLHGIGALRELETGRLNVSDETVELEGAVKLDNLTAFRAAAGDRVDWESKVTLLLNEVAPYRLSAVKSSNGGVSVSGYAPGEASRESVVHIASEIFGRDQVETQLELAAGVPTGDWTGAVNSALSGLALLDEGSVELVDADAFLTGIAPDQSAVTQIVVAASNMPQGFTLSDELTVALPRISPFTFNVTKGASVWEVSGYAPDETTRDRLFSKIRNSAGGIAVTGDIALAEGMPVETWPDLVSQGVNALNSLETGSLAVSDESVRLDGQVKPENLAVLRAATSDRHVWQNGVSLLLDDVSPYRLSALKSADGSVVLSGFAPGEIEKDEVIGLASDVFGADRIDSELALAAGAPSGDWSGAMAYSFAGLALLNEGYVELLDRAVKLSGVAADQSVVDEVASAALHLPAGFSWSDDLQVLRPLISPFTLNVTKAGEGWSVSGYAPDEATRELLMSTIRSAAGDTPFTGELYLADGMPSETWPDLVVNGIGTLGKLEAATLKVSDETVQLEGLAKISAVAPRKTEKFTTDAPKPASLYESRPTEVDDLKQVKGIGPVMERILNEHGCYHFKQLANFSEQDIEWVSATIDTFPDRITRDRWVEQAQELYYEKYGENCDADMRSQSA